MKSLPSLLSEQNILFILGGEHRHVREGWIGVDCPWCGGSGKYHLGVHLSTLRATCWRCGYHKLTEVLARLLRVSSSQARVITKDLPRTARIESEPIIARGRLETPSMLEDLSEPHLRYLRRRGFDPRSLIELWGLRGLGPFGRPYWRIWIPVRLDGKTVSWTTRSIGDGGSPRYIHAEPDQEAWPIKTLLYGWDHVRHSVIVCEGPTDVWRIGPGAVAVFGLNVSVEQMQRLAEVPKRIVCFDSEPVAQRASEKLCRELSIFPGETIRVALDSADPGEATEEEVERLRSLLE